MSHRLWWGIGAAALLLASLAGPALAQEAADPPARVAHVSQRHGGVVFAPQGEDEWLELEIRRAGLGFDGTPTAVVGPFPPGPLEAAIDLAPGIYDWRCRSSDAWGGAGDWTPFQGEGGGGPAPLQLHQVGGQYGQEGAGDEAQGPPRDAEQRAARAGRRRGRPFLGRARRSGRGSEAARRS